MAESNDKSRAGTPQSYLELREDLLRRAGTEWRIARRKILLDQNVLLSKNLTFFF